MKVLFASDVHLGAGNIADNAAHERRFVDFLLEEGPGAEHIYLLGDILDYWYEYRHVVPKGYVRFFGALARLSDMGVKITWMTGNHDIWLFGYLHDELGIEIIDAPYICREIGGKHFLLAHGDRVGRSTVGFRFICSLFRNRFCQRLYASLHPGLTIPFAQWWSRSSRASGCNYDSSSQHNIKRIIEDASELVARHPNTDFMVEGHHHVAIEQKLSGCSATIVVLGDWIEGSTYAVFDGSNITLREFVKR